MSRVRSGMEILVGEDLMVREEDEASRSSLGKARKKGTVKRRGSG